MIIKGRAMVIDKGRKQQILDHIKRTSSTDTSKKASVDSLRKKQIMDHIKRTQN